MKLTNLSRTPLGIPRNSMLLPGQSMNCKHWDEVRKNRIVASWINSGALAVGEAEAVEEVAETVEPPAPIQEPEAAEPEAAEEEQEPEPESDDDDILGEKSEQRTTRRRRRSK